MPRNIRQVSLLFLALMIGFSGLLTACGVKSSIEGHDLTMASLDGMPLKIINCPVAVQRTYPFGGSPLR